MNSTTTSSSSKEEKKVRKLREAVFDALASQRVGEKDPVFRQAAANFFTKLTSFNTINFKQSL